MTSTCHGRLVKNNFYTWRCQRCDNEKNESSSAVPGWTDTHCVLRYTRKGSSPENAGSVKLINVLKLDVAQMSPPVVGGSQSRAASVSSNAPMAAPHQDAMPHIRFKPVARQHGEQPRTATHHTIKCGCGTQPTILQRMWPCAANPSERKSAVSMRGSQAAEHFFVAVLTINR